MQQGKHNLAHILRLHWSSKTTTMPSISMVSFFLLDLFFWNRWVALIFVCILLFIGTAEVVLSVKLIELYCFVDSIKFYQISWGHFRNWNWQTKSQCKANNAKYSWNKISVTFYYYLLWWIEKTGVKLLIPVLTYWAAVDNVTVAACRLWNKVKVAELTYFV